MLHMPTLEEALCLLQDNARPGELPGMARFGMDVRQRLGVPVPVLRRLARRLGRDHALALDLWNTAIPDAQILAGMVADPGVMSSRQMDGWVRTLRSWDVCDGACLNAFVRSPLAWGKVPVWAARRDEFVKRAGFALLATLAVHDRFSPDERFAALLPVIETAARDDRNFVKKAVSWALRNIGKRSTGLHVQASECAQRLLATDSRSSRWIAADALRELRSDSVRSRLRMREIGFPGTTGRPSGGNIA